jgi:hypothetical protein
MKDRFIDALETGQVGYLPQWQADAIKRPMPDGAPTCSKCRRAPWNCVCVEFCTRCAQPYEGAVDGEAGECPDCCDGGDE